MKETILHPKHRELGAKLAEFAGFEMPIQYKGIIHEHNAVRENVGIFDVSHMGRIVVKGPEAEDLLDFLSTNKIAGKKAGSATYTVWCHPHGGCVDDMLVYRLDEDEFFVVVNASNREKDLAHLKKHAEPYEVEIVPCYESEGILAVQGAKAVDLVSEIFPEASEMKPMKVRRAEFNGDTVLLASTGYTGSGGFEIYASNEMIDCLWDLFLEKGQPYGIEPAGLGARDTLRLEVGLALYGHELADDIYPTETVSAWTVKMNGRDFVGKEALEKLQAKRHQYGAVVDGSGIAREGSDVFFKGERVGKVTSGSFSPSLKQAIAIVLVDRKFDIDDTLEIQVRQRKLPARVIKMPFYKP
jgi:aminomethyltransferase